MPTEEYYAQQRLDRELTENPKVGDQWLTGTRNYNATLVSVVRTTKTRITFSDGTQLLKSTGREVGIASSHWYCAWYLPATPQRIREVEEAKREREIELRFSDAVRLLQGEIGLGRKEVLTKAINDIMAIEPRVEKAGRS